MFRRKKSQPSESLNIFEKFLSEQLELAKQATIMEERESQVRIKAVKKALSFNFFFK